MTNFTLRVSDIPTWTWPFVEVLRSTSVIVSISFRHRVQVYLSCEFSRGLFHGSTCTGCRRSLQAVGGDACRTQGD